MSELTVAGLAIYPVKSLRGISLSEMLFDARGPQGDRRFVVTDVDGHFLTQRQHARMCLIDVELRGETCVLTAAGMAALTIDPACAGERRVVEVWGDRVEACDMGDAAAEWLSRFLGVTCRLHGMAEYSARAVNPEYGRSGDQVGFADGFPVLLITEASLEAINRELPAPIGAERFRANIVVRGNTPFAEDDWRRLRIGGAGFDVVKPCSRCVIPSIDPQTAEKQRVVSEVLVRLRRRDGKVYFGQNLIYRGGGGVCLGDAVTVLE